MNLKVFDSGSIVGRRIMAIREPAGGLSSRRPDFQNQERTGSNPSMSAIVPVRPSRGLILARTANPARA